MNTFSKSNENNKNKIKGEQHRLGTNASIYSALIDHDMTWQIAKSFKLLWQEATEKYETLLQFVISASMTSEALKMSS